MPHGPKTSITLFARQLHDVSQALLEGRYEKAAYQLEEIAVGVKLVSIRPEFRAMLAKRGADPETAADVVTAWLRSLGELGLQATVAERAVPHDGMRGRSPSAGM